MDIRNHERLAEIRNALIQNDHFLVTTHIHPDGDSIASILLVGCVLDVLKKEFRLIIDDAVPRKFDFLQGVGRICTNSEQLGAFRPGGGIILDASHRDRTGKIHHLIPADVPLINIDHHPSNTQFGSINLVDVEESSTTEIVYALIRSMEIPVSQSMASMVYSGIVCDTGRFLFPNTTLRSMAVCTEMIKKGASPSDIGENLYCRTNQTTIRALAVALSTLEFHFDERVACISLSNGTLEKMTDLDTEGFVDYLLAIEGTIVEFFMFEIEKDLFRISFRSKNKVDVNRVAKDLGGGGHARAAGCVIRGDLNSVKNRILNALRNHL